MHINLLVSGLHNIHIISNTVFHAARNLQGEGVDVAVVEGEGVDVAVVEGEGVDVAVVEGEGVDVAVVRIKLEKYEAGGIIHANTISF